MFTLMPSHRAIARSGRSALSVLSARKASTLVRPARSAAIVKIDIYIRNAFTVYLAIFTTAAMNNINELSLSKCSARLSNNI